ncbi:hypothetical protein TNIN_479431 [Trichonephila inaurata madagascariensis]|uniref:Uncharacterized protein n=1 Tax=Trichonephila inaurata madagascariensis TaxID=2747483 RepID=A0A8X6MLM7_9ARAC|nr:hypothetical protein TNIN_479431 [Trichonephila inaurata madagascariensis]
MTLKYLPTHMLNNLSKLSQPACSEKIVRSLPYFPQNIIRLLCPRARTRITWSELSLISTNNKSDLHIRYRPEEGTKRSFFLEVRQGPLRCPSSPVQLPICADITRRVPQPSHTLGLWP